MVSVLLNYGTRRIGGKSAKQGADDVGRVFVAPATVALETTTP